MPTVDSARIAAAIAAFFTANPRGAVVAYLFGSLARGTDRVGHSDVDLAILFEQAPPQTLAGLPVDLEDELIHLVGQPVDIVVLNTAQPDLIHRVLRDGHIVFEGDRSARIRFEVRARNEYFDLLPLLEAYRRRRPTAVPPP